MKLYLLFLSIFLLWASVVATSEDVPEDNHYRVLISDFDLGEIDLKCNETAVEMDDSYKQKMSTEFGEVGCENLRVEFFQKEYSHLQNGSDVHEYHNLPANQSGNLQVLNVENGEWIYRLNVHERYGSSLRLICQYNSENLTQEQFAKTHEITSANFTVKLFKETEPSTRNVLVWRNIDEKQNIYGLENAVVTAYDEDSWPCLYICRCVNCHGGHTIPGFVITNSQICHVTYNYKAYEHGTNYQVLTNPNLVPLKWVPEQRQGRVPARAVIGGQEADGTVYYIGRSEGSQSVGKVHPKSFNFFYSNKNGGERDHYFRSYEVLALAN